MRLTAADHKAIADLVVAQLKPLLLSPTLPVDDGMQMKAAVYASGGAKALKELYKADAERKARHA